MRSLFSEDFFQQALMGLFVAVTLFQIVFAGTALWVFHAISARRCSSGWRGGLTILSPEIVGRSGGAGVSIVICARNEAPNLRLHLPKVLAQQYPGDWEILVVDDASEDDTSALLLEFQQDNPRLHSLKITAKTHPGKKHALAAGIAAAKYDLILLSDADCAPASAYWLQGMTAVFASDPAIKIVLGYGPMKQTEGGRFLESWTRFETAFTAIQYCSFAYAGLPYMGVGRNLAFEKTLFERSGGFSAHEHIASGDDDLFVNANATADNTSVCLCPETFVFSEGKQTWKTWVRQKKRHLSAGVAYKRQHQFLLAMVSLSHVLHFFLLVLLLLIGTGTKTVLVLWLLRSLWVFLLYRKAFSTLGERQLLPLFPIFDAMLALYYGAFVPIQLITRSNANNGLKRPRRGRTLVENQKPPPPSDLGEVARW
jgi:biofilm PGA synthesis N-glycosyltransferase PgaC